jgi:hypothetical protein
MSFSDEDIQKVWEKGDAVTGQDAGKWRKDKCGAWIGRDKYGNRQSDYGWEIDHIDPDGGDGMSNLRPLQWENNLDKSDKKRLTCIVTSEGVDNVKK